MLLVFLICLAALFLFSREFLSFYRTEQRRQFNASYRPLTFAMTDGTKSPQEILELAKEFADNNRSFRFIIREGDGEVLFSTYNMTELPEADRREGLRFRFTSTYRNREGETESYFILTGYNLDSGLIDYNSFVRRLLLALALMLIIAILGAVLFAKKVTKPLEDEKENQQLFFSAASHELKTPIAATRALVEGMIAGIGDYRDPPKYLRECLLTLDAQGALVSEILEIVKLSDRETEPSFDNFDCAQLGGAVLDEYRPHAELKSLQITGEFPACFIRSDRYLLQKVLSNVIANAVQNTPRGGTISIEAEKRKNLRLAILNTGVHIPAEILPRLFEPFYRLDAARTRGTQNGLGLAIVKKALDRMKCPFALENTGEGVVFWVELSLAKFRKTSD